MMGADLILTAVSLPTNEDDTLATFEQLRQHALSFIAEVTDEQRLDVIEELTGDGYDIETIDEEADDIDFGYGFEIEEGATWRDAVDKRLREAVTNLFSDDGLPRDCTIMQLGGTWWLFSGGTSWGDSFESMGDVGALYAIGCFGDGTANHVRIRVT